MEKLWLDLRFALRTMAKNRGFAAIAVLVLALGIGSTTAIFSVVNAVLIRPLPYKDPARLVAFTRVYQQNGKSQAMATTSYIEIEAWRRYARSFESVGSFVVMASPIKVGEQALHVVAASADPEFLSTISANLEMGHNFAGSGASQKDSSVIVTHRLWMNAFHGDPAVIGRTMTVDGDLYTVSGVLSATFKFPRSDAFFFADDPDLIFPIANIVATWGRENPNWFALGRLAPGVSLSLANEEMSSLYSSLGEQNPQVRGIKTLVTSLDAETTRQVRPALLLMMGISTVLLLIACTNIMNLLFSRAAARGREMAIRKAVGATTGRLVRQMLTESACLTFSAGIIGVGIALFVLDALVSLFPSHLPVSGHVGIDMTVLGFAFLVCTLASLFAGVIPALHRSRRTENLVHAGMRTSGGRGLPRFQRGLMISQMTLGVGLLTAAGLFAHSLLKLNSVNPGFRTQGVFGFEISVPSNHARSEWKHLYQRMLDETRSIPGVISAGWISLLPPETRRGTFIPFSIVGAAAQPTGHNRPSCNFQITSEGYFETVGVALDHGRDFAVQDAAGAPPVIIINETLARRFFGNSDPLGQRIVTMFDSKDASREVVGIISDIHDRGLAANSIPTAYVPYEQFAFPYGAIVVRTDMPLGVVVPEIRRRIGQIDPAVPINNFTTISARIHKTLDEPRFYTVMAGACALMAVLFVTLGLYGVIAYSVARRTSEIGIRMALGAPQNMILRSVLWEGLQMAAIGVAIGLAVSLAATRIMQKLLFEVKPNDPATLAAASVLVLLVTLAASYIPARRASKVDPVVALRYE